MPDGEHKRGVAKCRSCSSVFAVDIWGDGTVRPIGRQDCDCGANEFQLIGNLDEAIIQDSETPDHS
ncbi:hypothetical protein EA473_22270 [Natrarchaeobius chitinivorans]|uniref:Uncharacterized protein n=1 Tax=Natrarchaeobius chitinivorans TaxID=1679083 RepID=A0A3N6P2E5_NATCH|nr:hypothetical protein EA473_22270 [Natrarchaeobius chitinivorans]